jgi:hypothetical protein
MGASLPNSISTLHFEDIPTKSHDDMWHFWGAKLLMNTQSGKQLETIGKSI